MADDTLTTARLAELREVAEKATPGERYVEHDRNDQPCLYVNRADDDPRHWVAMFPHQCVRSIEVMANADAAFAAAFDRETCLALIAEARETANLRARLAVAGEGIDRDMYEMVCNERDVALERLAATEQERDGIATAKSLTQQACMKAIDRANLAEAGRQEAINEGTGLLDQLDTTRAALVTARAEAATLAGQLAASEGARDKAEARVSWAFGNVAVDHPTDCKCPPCCVVKLDIAEAERDAARAEVAELRETNNRLNKRCQSAESGLAAALRGEGAKPGPGGFGRMLANSAAAMYASQLKDAHADALAARGECERLREALAGLGKHKQFRDELCFCHTIDGMYCVGQHQCKQARDALARSAPSGPKPDDDRSGCY
jgi:hypothetical protein